MAAADLMATVTNTIKLPDGSAPTYAAVEIELIAADSGHGAGWVTATDVTVLAVSRPTVTAGAWTATLTPNDDIEPADTVYRVNEYVDRLRYVHYIDVPTGGGTVHDLLVDPPAALATAALTAHMIDPIGAHAASAISVLDTAGNFSATTVEAALAELEARSERAKPTSGAGTLLSPWVHADGTGGINTAIAAAATSGKPVEIGPGYYTITTMVGTGAVSGMEIRTAGAATKLVVDPAIAGGLAVGIIGTSGSHLDFIRVGGFHLIRSGAGSVRVDYVDRSDFGLITGTGTGGGVLSIRRADRCQFEGVIGQSLGPSGAAVFANGMTRCQFGPIIGDGGQETVDLFESHYNQFSKILSFSPVEEALDMGCCQYNQFNELLSVGAGGAGVSCKIEDGATSGGSKYNKFGNLTLIDFTTYGVSFSNSPAVPNGTDVNNYNTVDHVTAVSSVSGAKGLRVSSGSVNPRITGIQFRNVHIVTPSYGIEILASDDCVAVGGYVESTGAIAVLVDGSSDATAVTGAEIRGLKIKSAGAGSSSGALQLSRVLNSRIVDNEILSSSGYGILLSRVKHTAVDDNFVHDCQYHGISLDVVDVADWRGAVHVSISRNRVRDIGKVGGTRYALRVNALGSTDTDVIRMDDNNVWDTQASKTTTGVLWAHAGATFRYSSYVGNIIKDVLATGTGTPGGTGSVSTPNISAT